MTAPAAPRLPLTILGGFLGSGKTTLLERWLLENDATVIVNDTGDRSPDLPSGVHPLLGGCACCERLDSLIELLRTLCESRHRDGGPRRAVLETSGLADPAHILAAVERDPVLASNVRVADVCITIDAERGISDLLHEPLARAQVEQADTVLVTKADLVDVDFLTSVAATVAAVNPGARIEAVAFGEPAPLPGYSAADAIALPETEVLAAPESAWVPVPGIVDWTVLSLWLAALVVAHPTRVLRVKGMLRTPRGPLILHAARGTVAVPAPLDPAADIDDTDCGLLLVVRDLDPQTVARSWDAHRRALSAA